MKQHRAATIGGTMQEIIVVGLIFGGLILLAGLVICAIILLTGHVVRPVVGGSGYPNELR
jgi:hypothetical protein